MLEADFYRQKAYSKLSKNPIRDVFLYISQNYSGTFDSLKSLSTERFIIVDVFAVNSTTSPLRLWVDGIRLVVAPQSSFSITNNMFTRIDWDTGLDVYVAGVRV